MFSTQPAQRSGASTPRSERPSGQDLPEMVPQTKWSRSLVRRENAWPMSCPSSPRTQSTQHFSRELATGGSQPSIGRGSERATGEPGPTALLRPIPDSGGVFITCCGFSPGGNGLGLEPPKGMIFRPVTMRGLPIRVNQNWNGRRAWRRAAALRPGRKFPPVFRRLVRNRAPRRGSMTRKREGNAEALPSVLVGRATGRE